MGRPPELDDADILKQAEFNLKQMEQRKIRKKAGNKSFQVRLKSGECWDDNLRVEDDELQELVNMKAFMPDMEDRKKVDENEPWGEMKENEEEMRDVPFRKKKPKRLKSHLKKARNDV